MSLSSEVLMFSTLFSEMYNPSLFTKNSPGVYFFAGNSVSPMTLKFSSIMMMENYFLQKIYSKYVLSILHSGYEKR